MTKKSFFYSKKLYFNRKKGTFAYNFYTISVLKGKNLP